MTVETSAWIILEFSMFVKHSKWDPFRTLRIESQGDEPTSNSLKFLALHHSRMPPPQTNEDLPRSPGKVQFWIDNRFIWNIWRWKTLFDYQHPISITDRLQFSGFFSWWVHFTWDDTSHQYNFFTFFSRRKSPKAGWMCTNRRPFPDNVRDSILLKKKGGVSRREHRVHEQVPMTLAVSELKPGLDNPHLCNGYFSNRSPW